MATAPELGPWEPLRWRGAGPLELARRLCSRVALALPVYRAPTFAHAEQVKLLESLGAMPLRLEGAGNVAMARNAITARWLADTQRPWLLSIDADVSAPEGPAVWIEFLSRAFERFPHFEEAVCGCYPHRRRGGGRFAVSFCDGVVTLGQGGGYYRAKWAGAGALLLHRSQVEQLGAVDGCRRLRYRFAGGSYEGPQVWHNTWIEAPDGVLEEAGEDVGLTQDLVTIERGLWCDTRLRLDHDGFTWEDAAGPEPRRSPSITLTAGGPS